MEGQTFTPLLLWRRPDTGWPATYSEILHIIRVLLEERRHWPTSLPYYMDSYQITPHATRVNSIPSLQRLHALLAS